MRGVVTLSMAIVFSINGASVALSETLRQRHDRFRVEAAAMLARGDVADAARLATLAYSSLPNGAKITFTPDAANVVAAITYSSHPTPFRMTLTRAQFNAWLVEYDYWSDFLHSARWAGETTVKAGNPRSQTGPSRQAGASYRGTQTSIDDDLRPFATPALAARYPDRYRPLPDNYRSPPVQRLQTDMSTEEGIRAQAERIYPWLSQSAERERWIADKISEQLDRQRGNAYSIRVR
jgi:hypothetical protein